MKSILIGIFFRPPSQNEFLELIIEGLHAVDFEKHEVFILGDFNMLVELTREEIQPIIYDWQNFQNNMDKIFDNEQLKRTMKQEKLLKEFKEHTIGKIFLL